MGDDGNNETKPRRARSWIRLLLGAGAVLVVLLVLFHGPILRPVVRGLAIHLAARQHLKLDFQIQGSIVGGLTLKHVHGSATGPSMVESIDADLVHADYSLLGFLFHGMPGLLQNIEVRSASLVLDPDKAPLAPPSKPNEKISLPLFFPEQLHLANVNLTIRSAPQDLVVGDLNIDLNPQGDGELHIARLQIPGVHSWTNIAAITSYTNRNLFLRNLTLDPQNKFQVVNVDASKIGSKALAITIDGVVAGGKIKGTIALRQKRSSLESNIHLGSAGISLAQLSEYFGQPAGALAGDVENLNINGHGILNRPRTWNGTISARVTNVHQKQLALDRVELDITAADGVATIGAARITGGKNRVELSGTATLPQTTEDFGRAPANLKLAIAAPELETLTGFLSPPLTGAGQATGTLTIRNETIALHLAVTGDQIGFDKAVVNHLAATIQASKKMPPSEKKTPYYANLISNIRAELSDVHYQEYVVDSMRVEASSKGDAITVHPIALIRNANEITLEGRSTLPLPGRDFAGQPADLSVAFHAPQLADFWNVKAAGKITGALQGNAQVHLADAAGRGQFSVHGENIMANNLLVKQLSAQGAMSGHAIYLNDLTAALNEKGFVGAHGSLSLESPHHYTGQVNVNIADLSTLEPLLKAAGDQNQLAGKLVMNWQGSGDAATFKNNGALNLTLEKGRYGDLRSLEAKVEAHYSPEALEIPTVFLGSDKMDFQAIVQAKGSILEISKIQVVQGQAKYVAGYVSLPFVWRNVGTGRPLFPSDGKVMVTFQSENLDLKKLAEDFGAQPVASGLVNLKFDAQGTLANPVAKLEVQARDLRSEKYKNFEPASFDLTAGLSQKQLAITGKIQQARIQPVEIDAHLPLDVANVLEEGKLNEQTPVVAKIHLPRSSVNFLRQFVPAVQEIDGDLALDVNVNGTIANPILSGAGDMTINVMRFTNATLPAIQDFKARLEFNRDTLSLARFGGQLAGGPFTLSGKISFPKLTNPQIDLQLKASDVLVARNDSLTARADADVRVNGPLASASVTGTVALTNSQFLKNIDLIPIGLPGRPAPQPTESRPTLSFPDPPLRDWKFDIAIKTKDPFLIRGNLANGGAIVDLKLSGTGLHPGLQGTVRLENVEATLPFSRLEINYGYLYFNPDDSLNPKIDLHGTSLIRDYTVHVYVYGASLSPEAIFTSEPPLPQEEIISLLATGTTRAELTGNNNVLAGRAAMLLVQQLYRKVFKKGQATQSNSVFDRLQVDLGNVDPKTGQQTATARFKIDEHFLLVGDIEVGGDFRGMVRYLLRFR